MATPTGALQRLSPATPPTSPGHHTMHTRLNSDRYCTVLRAVQVSCCRLRNEQVQVDCRTEGWDAPTEVWSMETVGLTAGDPSWLNR